MKEPLYFPDDKAFEIWLKENYDTAEGTDIYLYKKGYESEGLTYEQAVRTALCYGWIDAVTHSCDEKRFRQYFAPRRRNSSWSLSNMIRVRDLIADDRMTEYGLTYFDITWLDTLDERITKEKAAKNAPVALPVFCQEIFEEAGVLSLFHNRTKGEQRRFLDYIQEGKKEETRLRRCHRIVQVLNGERPM